MFLHAHPDDEALLTGGTIARLARQGHRVLIITATDGSAGLTSSRRLHDGQQMAAVRRAELARSAQALGAAAVIHLGHADSGLDGMGSPSTPGMTGPRGEPFVAVPVDEVASRVAGILERERATCVVGYDASGGYGHPDHVHVHHVARRAAALAGTPLLLEASLPGGPYRAAARAAQALARVVPAVPATALATWTDAYCTRRALTHRVDVRPALAAKRRALLAHTSQAVGGLRTLDVLLRLPPPAFARALGTEWFLGPVNPAGRWYRHPLESLRTGPPGSRG